MSNSKLKSIGVVPEYPDVKLYSNQYFGMVIWEADPWKEVCMSWKESCYIHAGISMDEMIWEGKDAQKALSAASINNVYKWPVGKSKHLVQCNKDGLIATHGLTHRDSETRFRQFSSSPQGVFMQIKSDMDVKFSTRKIFIFQFAGPKSLQALEKATGESLRDVEFLAARSTRIPGIPAEIEVTRIGMAGTLAYELRGAAEHGPAVYDAVYQAGKPLGMKRLGWLSYVVNHVEGGFPQQGCTFTHTFGLDPSFLTGAGADHKEPYTGSVDPANVRARLRTPREVGWTWMAKFDHDFEGSEAVEAEAKHPKRTIVTLRWNPEDLADIYASLFKKGEEYKTFDLPCGQPMPAGGHADHVTTKDGKQIGVSSGTIYSYYYREVISHCTIDVDQAKIGNNVVVHWGDYGKRIKEVRATVERFPYLDLPRNENYDLSTVPSGVSV
jgi:glycine cleavage system aminomethyltransferase T